MNLWIGIVWVRPSAGGMINGEDSFSFVLLLDCSSARRCPRGEQSAEDTNENESSPLIIPPADRLTHDSYPQIHAQDTKEQDN